MSLHTEYTITLLGTPTSQPTPTKTVRLHSRNDPTTPELKRAFPSFSPSMHSVKKEGLIRTLQPKETYKSQASTANAKLDDVLRRIEALEKEAKDKERERAKTMNMLLRYEAEGKLAQGLNDMIKRDCGVTTEDIECLKEGGKSTNYLPHGFTQYFLSSTVPPDAALLLPPSLFQSLPSSTRARFASTNLTASQESVLHSILRHPLLDPTTLKFMMTSYIRRQSMARIRNIHQHPNPSPEAMQQYFESELPKRGFVEFDIGWVLRQAREFVILKDDLDGVTGVPSWESIWGEDEFEEEEEEEEDEENDATEPEPKRLRFS